MTREEMVNKTWEKLKKIGLPIISVTCGAKQQAKQQVVVLVWETRNEEKANEIINILEEKLPSNATLKISHDKYGFTMIRLYFQY